MRDLETKDRETRLLRLANRQYGLLRYTDLTGAGLDRRAIWRRVDACRLTRVHDGVFAFGHTALTDEGRWLAALWTCGDDAVLSHLSAVVFNAMGRRSAGDDVHVSTTRRVRSRDGLVVHQVRHLDRPDTYRRGPFTVTTVPRTFVDVADLMAWDEFRALADAQRRLEIGRIHAAQRRSPKRPGSPRVTRLLEADDAHTKSEFERRYLRFCRRRGLPLPDDLNAWTAGHKADCVYRDARLVVELDGRGYHARRAQMRADRQRDSNYQLARWHILRLVWDDLSDREAELTADRVRRMLAL